MAHHGWYNANEYRAFPFIYTTEELLVSNRVMVDFGCSFGPSSPLNDEESPAVWLYQIRRTCSVYEFDFRTNVGEAARYALVFVRDANDPEYTHSFAEATLVDSETSAYDCPDSFVWEGFLVTGMLSDLNLADGGTIVFDDFAQTVEPSLLHSTTFVDSISLANYDRTRAYSDCVTNDLDPERLPIVNTMCMVGNLKMKEGYNCAIRQDDTNNTITISGAVGGGNDGPSCSEVALHDDEIQDPALSGRYLSGGPACDEIITSINGVTGQNIRLIPGNGVQIEQDPDNPNGLLVTVDLNRFTSCLL